jgi:hypothetical protein
MMNNPAVVAMLTYFISRTPPTILARAHNEMGRARLGFALYRLTGMMNNFEEQLPFDLTNGGDFCQDTFELLEFSPEMKKLLRIADGFLDYQVSVAHKERQEISEYIARNTPFPPRA